MEGRVRQGQWQSQCQQWRALDGAGACGEMKSCGTDLTGSRTMSLSSRLTRKSMSTCGHIPPAASAVLTRVSHMQRRHTAGRMTSHDHSGCASTEVLRETVCHAAQADQIESVRGRYAGQQGKQGIS